MTKPRSKKRPPSAESAALIADPNAPERVVILFSADGTNVSTLAYDGGKGKIRVYDRDQYDARLDTGRTAGQKAPYICTASDAIDFVLRHKMKEIQVPLHVARALGYTDRELGLQ